jgi:hypothetical protein
MRTWRFFEDGGRDGEKISRGAAIAAQAVKINKKMG